MTVGRLTALVFWHKSVVKCCYVGLELEWSGVEWSGVIHGAHGLGRPCAWPRPTVSMDGLGPAKTTVRMALGRLSAHGLGLGGRAVRMHGLGRRPTVRMAYEWRSADRVVCMASADRAHGLGPADSAYMASANRVHGFGQPCAWPRPTVRVASAHRFSIIALTLSSYEKIL